MLKVGDVAKELGINDQTVRVWCKQFSDYLSSGANPSKGETRGFTEEDLRVFRYAQYALNRGHTYDDVWAQLSSGNALKPLNEVFGVDMPTTTQTGNSGAIIAPGDLLESFGAISGQLVETGNERDYLRGALQSEIMAHGETKERAAKAEEKARGLQEGLTRGEKWQRLTVLLLTLLVIVLVIGFVILVFVK